jgi:hypothetical protein
MKEEEQNEIPIKSLLKEEKNDADYEKPHEFGIHKKIAKLSNAALIQV